jgi:hypothetical protein
MGRYVRVAADGVKLTGLRKITLEMRRVNDDM